MYLIDDIHLVSSLRRTILDLLPDTADVINTVVRRRVDLHHIHICAGCDITAHITFSAWTAVHRMLAVDRAGEYLRRRGFARAARAGEKVGVREPSLRDLPLQRFGDVLLPDHVGEGFGPPLAVQRLIHTTLPLS